MCGYQEPCRVRLRVSGGSKQASVRWNRRVRSTRSFWKKCDSNPSRFARSIVRIGIRILETERRSDLRAAQSSAGRLCPVASKEIQSTERAGRHRGFLVRGDSLDDRRTDPVLNRHTRMCECKVCPRSRGAEEESMCS